MKNLFTHGAFLGSLVLLGVGAVAPAAAQTAYGLVAYSGAFTQQSLVTFDLAAPGTFLTTVPITGLTGGLLSLTGLAVRPATGELFTLGHNQNSAQVQLYTLHRTTGVLTAIGPPQGLGLGPSPTLIGFAFDPTTDRLRVVGANRTNYRFDPSTGALAGTDTPLAYATTDVNAAAVPTVGSVAYLTSPIGTPTVYALDVNANRLATLDPSTSGTLHTAAQVLGVSLNPGNSSAELDIARDPVSGPPRAYLATASAASDRLAASRLYTLDLRTGVATLVGALGDPGSYGYVFVSDIALPNASGPLAVTSVAEPVSDWSLSPNPLANETHLRIHLLRAARVEWTVTDALGREVDRVDAGQIAAGAHALPWTRRHLRAGVYFFRLCLDGKSAGTRQGVLIE
jgi:hypothetical protein